MDHSTTNQEQTLPRTKKLILAALMAALTCVGTMIIKVPTPTNGYIHPGDGFVLLSGLLLGPLWGALAAGIGSALSDLIGGYFIYVPATFVIKALTALVAVVVYRGLRKAFEHKSVLIALIGSGIAGEAIMVIGYFLFEIFMLAAMNQSSLTAGVIASLAGILPNIIQGVFGVVIATILHPLLTRLIQA
ncbi:MAG: ECF transporter S component [Lachnospiraceae bacterium]|nr:ECF transporter S component [Lachnospiraceae bacterium]